MSLNPSKALDFSKELIEWFWKFGITRGGAYQLTTGGWLREVYEASERIALAEKSQENLRPAFALWGPSQAGKSTFLSNFLDEKVWADLQPDQEVDPGKSGLSWPGADPCVFFVDLPSDQMHRYKGISMNPFTGGRDASAVLTRFVRGSLRPVPGMYHIPHPKYPVQLHFLGEKQVMHALAMGYDSDCLGNPQNKWQQNEWSQTEFRSAIDQFNIANPTAEGTPINRQAFEIIHCLCEVLVDLVTAKVRRFQKLSLSAPTAEWQSLIISLFEQPALLASPENARKFTSLILWDGSEPISEYYNVVLRMLENIDKMQKTGNAVYTTLKVATQLLDMDTYDKVDNGTWKLPKISYRSEGGDILVDLNQGEPLVENVEQFGSLQGLVWEIVVPVNFDNLSESKFTEFLGKGDLLDFPGVANEQANNVKKIAAWSNIAERERLIPEKDRLTLSDEQQFTPYLFFAKILKRGKTASIVSTYAKRLTIDGFTIVQYLDRHPPVNADQIQNGINTWWDCMAPGYDHSIGGKSPLPLNLALTWWSELFGTYQTLLSRGNQYFPAKLQILQALGKVSDPKVLWSSTALNYYKIDRGQPKSDFAPDDLFSFLLTEWDVVRQFASRPLRESLDSTFKGADSKTDRNVKQKFEAWAATQGGKLTADSGLETLKIMLNDRTTGGATHLLTLLCQQLDDLARGQQLNRSKILEESRLREAERLERLLQGEFMFPPPEARDTRRENLERFRKNLEKATSRQVGNKVELLTEDEMVPINLALRELLNVDNADVVLPTFNHSITPDYISQQFQAWIRKQASRWRLPDPSDTKNPSSWTLLGLTSPGLVEMYLNSLADSITADQKKEIARWLREDVRPGSDGGGVSARRKDYSSLLAVQMSNVLMGDHSIDYDGESKPASYAAVIEPFLREQLPALIKAPVNALVQVAVPGTKELEVLCDQFDIERPAPSATL